MLGAALGIGKAAFGLGQMLFAKKPAPMELYKENPYAGQQLGMAQQLFNGRMAGASNAEQGIQANQANAYGNIQRNAGDASQALALASGVQANSNDALNDLAGKEGQNKYNLLDNLNKGYQAMVGEGDKVYASKQQKFNQENAQYQQQIGGGIQNLFGGLGDTASFMHMNKQLKQQQPQTQTRTSPQAATYNAPQTQSWTMPQGATWQQPSSNPWGSNSDDNWLR